MPKTARIPSYKLHKASGQARVIIRGRQIYLGAFGSPESQEKYARLIAEFAVGKEPEQSKPSDPTTLLMVELLAKYLSYAEGYYVKNGVPSGWLTHIRLVLRLLREHYAHLPVEEFGPLCLKSLQGKLVREGHCRGYINKLLAIVPRIFKWGVGEELVAPHVHLALRAVEGLKKGRTTAPDHPPVLPVAESVVDATLPHLPSIVADMVRLQRFTGMRPGEVCQVRPMDVDRSGDVWLYKVPGHKTEHFGRERVVCIGPKGQEVLMPYLLRAADAYCFSPAETVAKQALEKRARRRSPVQPSQRNRRKPDPRRAPKDHYTKDSYARAIRRGVTKANKAIIKDAQRAGIDDPQLLQYWAPNRLRHSRGTEVRKMFGLEAAQVTLGHAHARITEVYAERDTKLAAEIARKIG